MLPGHSERRAVPAAVPKRLKGTPQGVLKKRNWKVLVVTPDGSSEIVQWTKQDLMRRTGLPPRDLRPHGPLLSPAATILGREGCIIVSLENIKAVLAAEETFVLHPTHPEVLKFVSILQPRLRAAREAAVLRSMPVSEHADLTLLPDSAGTSLRPSLEPVGPSAGAAEVRGSQGVQAPETSGRPGNWTSGAGRGWFRAVSRQLSFPANTQDLEARGQEAAAAAWGGACGPASLQSREHDSGGTAKEGAAKRPGADAAPAAEAEAAAAAEELPFEFRVLEGILEATIGQLQTEWTELAGVAYPALEQLTRKVTTLCLQQIRGIKSKMTQLTSRVQKVRDELEQLLDDDQDMADLYLTRRLVWLRMPDSPTGSAQGDLHMHGAESVASAGVRGSLEGMGALGTNTMSALSSAPGGKDVEELERLLEHYFGAAEKVLNGLRRLHEDVDDTEDYVNIDLDAYRNVLQGMNLLLTAGGMILASLLVFLGLYSMNVANPLYHVHGIIHGDYGFAPRGYGRLSHRFLHLC